MSIKVQSLVRESTIRDRGLVDVLLYLADCCDDFGGNCFPGIARIAKMTRYSERAVIRIILHLQLEQWVGVERGDGAGNFSQYQVNVERLKECQDVTLSKRTQTGRKQVESRKKDADRDLCVGQKGCQADILFDSKERVTPVHERVTSTTEKGDKRDNPPHPLIGRTVSETSVETTPPLPPSQAMGDSSQEIPDDACQTKTRAADVAPHAHATGESQCALAAAGDAKNLARRGHAAALGQAGEGGLSDEFTPGQLEHLARCRPADLARWERFYRDENASISEAGRISIAEVEKAKREFPDRETAVKRVMQVCGFVQGTRRNPLPNVLDQVFGRCEQLGAASWTTGPMLVAAWEAKRKAGGASLHGALKFFRDGHWRDFVPSGKAAA